MSARLPRNPFVLVCSVHRFRYNNSNAPACHVSALYPRWRRPEGPHISVVAEFSSGRFQKFSLRKIRRRIQGMQNKRFAVVFSMLLVLAMVLSACTAVPAAPAQPAADAGAAGEAAAPSSDIKIGLVTDVGRVNDRSFNQ